jgi:steroid delta-isomerase
VPIVAEGDLRALLERHVELFNEAVGTGDYDAFLATFADHAVMRFDDLPIGPYVGKAQIIEAYAVEPPTDTMALIDMQEIGTDTVKAPSSGMPAVPGRCSCAGKTIRSSS